MDELPDNRTVRLDSPEARPEEPTAVLERDTLGNDLPRITNDTGVHQTDPRSQHTAAYVNDYERALPAHYKLIRLLGRGGMAEVFLALDERLNRSVAIKFLNSEFRRDPERMRRFHGEARAASALNHPNILIIHDIGENDGVQFIVSEYVQGETLKAHIAKGRLQLDEAVDIAIQIASALSASHRAGIVHRDVKPDNIMLRRDGSVKVLDFGLAKETGENLYTAAGFEAQTLEGIATSPGLILGTPQYMSPEQARGQRLDARTDIFSLGIILFEMVAGETPFPGDSMVDIIASIISKEPRKLADYISRPPEALEYMVGKALQKERAKRYGTVDELLTDLKKFKLGVGNAYYNPQDTKKGQTRATRENTVGAAISTSAIPWNLIIMAVIAVPLLFFIFKWYAGGRQENLASTSAMRSVPITSWSSGTGELVAAASFSPDAKMIAFAATKSGATEIWTKPVNGGEPIQVTKNGFYNQYPVWSPSGQEIAFFSSRGPSRGIWRVSFAGGEQMEIAGGVGPSARPLVWSTDGKIFYQDGSEIFTANRETGEKTRITNFEAKNIKPRTIQISRDGSALAYSIKDGDRWKVMISPVDGLPGREVASSKDQIDQIAWEPGGKTVVYSSAANGAYQVFRAGPGAETPVALSNGDNDLFVQDVSFDAGNILYGSVSETSDLWTINVEDGRQTPAVNDVAAEFWAEFSPNGKSLAYQSVNQPDRPFRGSVKTIALSSVDPIVISQEGFAPAWSNNGEWVAYFKRSDAGVSIWRARSSGGDAQKIADGAVTPPGYLATPYLKIGSSQISWAPDDLRIAYAARVDGRSNIWLVNADGSRNSAITSNSEMGDTYCFPMWSPDGRSLVYVSERGRSAGSANGEYRLIYFDLQTAEPHSVFDSPERFRFLGLSDGGKNALIAKRSDPKDSPIVPEATDIYEISIKTGSAKKIATLKNAYFDNIHVSSDKKLIAFTSRMNDVSSLWIIAANGGSPKQMFAENDPKILISSLAWSPDGRSIVFGKQTRTNLLSMLSN